MNRSPNLIPIALSALALLIALASSGRMQALHQENQAAQSQVSSLRLDLINLQKTVDEHQKTVVLMTNALRAQDQALQRLSRMIPGAAARLPAAQ